MGKFSSQVEKKLEKSFLEMYVVQGFSKSFALKTVKMMLEKAKLESKKEGTANLPPNYGDFLLDKKDDPKIKSMLDKVRREGANDNDIRTWWNLHDLERRMVVADDDISRLRVFHIRLGDGLKKEEAAARVRKYFAMYGDPEDTSVTQVDDRPLPYELKDRVNIYLEKKNRIDPFGKEFKEEIEASSTFNALVRKEIKKGNL
jgi:hypothetical protein